MVTSYNSTDAATFLLNLTLPTIKAQVLQAGKINRLWVSISLTIFLQTHPKTAGILRKSSYTESGLLDKIMR